MQTSSFSGVHPGIQAQFDFVSSKDQTAEFLVKNVDCFCLDFVLNMFDVVLKMLDFEGREDLDGAAPHEGHISHRVCDVVSKTS